MLRIYIYICLFRFAGAVLFGMVFVLLVFVGGGGTAYLRYILPVVVQTHKIMHVEIIVFFLNSFTVYTIFVNAR